MLKYRILTIVLLVPIVIWLIFFGAMPLKRAVLGLLMLVAWWEWYGLSQSLSRAKQAVSFVFLAGLAVLTHRSEFSQSIWALTSLFWVFASPLWLKQHWQLPPFARLLAGCVLIVSLFSSMSYLLHASPLLFLLSMGLIWVSDIMAYVTGRLFGKHKLALSISPGKTWEGALGGIVATIPYVWCVCALILKQPMPWWGVPAAVLLAAYGIVGDLWESLLKRQANKKDSGRLLPGHGGVLDRLDALFPVLPIIALVHVLAKF